MDPSTATASGPLIPSPDQIRASNVQAAPYNGGAAPTSTNQAMLVSSSPARAATADNITKLQTITAPAPTQLQPQVDKINSEVNAFNNGQTTTTTPGAGTGTGAGGATGTTGTPTGTPNTSGATPSSTSTTDPYDSAVSGISDPGLKAQFKTQLQNLDSQISSAQQTIDSVKARSLNDPAITSIVTAIQNKFGQQIQLMQEKNRQLLGRANTSVAAFGGLGVMSQDFLNNEQSMAMDRISKLQDEEDQAIAKAQAAYLSQNYKDLNTAMTAYDQANKDKLQALQDILNASAKQVTQMQNEQKINIQEQKAALASDIQTSTKIAAGVAANLKAAGLTDPESVRQYIESLASQYGIQNPDILYSQVVSAQQNADKQGLQAENIQSEIATRQENATTAAERAATAAERAANAASKPKKLSVSEIRDNFYAGLPQLDGKADSNGVPYYYTSKQDGSRYLTAQGFKTLLAAAKVDGISRGNFIKDNPDIFDPNGLDGYDLTAKEKAIIAKQ